MIKVSHIPLALSYLISTILIIGIGVSLYEGQWFNAFLATFSFVLTYIPAFFAKNFRLFLPLEFELALILFIFASIYLGEVQLYYTTFWWWDIVLHTSSGFLLGLVGFLLVYVLNTEKKFPLRLSPVFIGLFSFVFSVALGALWEIFEFLLDISIGTAMQHNSLQDTMTDLIVDVLGALFIAILGALYVKNVSVPVMSRLINTFLEKNHHFFRSKGNRKS